VERRGSFALFFGPVLVIAALTLAVLQPGELGRTGAMNVFILTIGVIWAFIGWMMTRDVESVDTMASVVAGASIGLAVAAIAGAADLASTGSLSVPVAVAVILWVVLAVYMTSTVLVPSMGHLLPDLRTAYSALAVAGAAALLAASAVFLYGGMTTVGVVEALIAVALIFMVAPDLREGGKAGLVLTALTSLVAVTTVVAFLIG
jgi:hypothetical protein